MAAQFVGAGPYPTALAHFPTLRQSMLAGFADCQLAAGFGLRMAIPKPGTQALHTSGYTAHRQAAGRLIHATIGAALREMLERREEFVPVERITELWDEQLRQTSARVDETYALPAHEDALARRTLRKWARDNRLTIADVYGVEERLRATVTYPDGAERVLTGQLDLLLVDPSNTHATVPDWKDTWKLPPKRPDADEWDDGEDDELSVEGYFQQRFYALLIFLSLPAIQSVTLREFYVRRSQPREATIWRHELPGLIAYFAATAERFDRCYEASIRTRRGRLRRRPLATPAAWGEPSPGGHCSYCPGAMDCPVPQEAREGGMARTPAEAQTLAGILIRAKRVATMTERSLRTWADLEGPIRVRDGKRDRFFGFIESSRVERPTLAQVDRAMLAGRDVRDLFKPRVGTRFADYSPEADVSRGLDDEQTVEMFERAAALARANGSRART